MSGYVVEEAHGEMYVHWRQLPLAPFDISKPTNKEKQ